VFHNTDPKAIAYQMAYWMKNKKYPVAALYSTSSHNELDFHHELWATVYQLDTGADPLTATNFQLNFAAYILQPKTLDPLQPDFVIDNIVDGNTFLQEFQAIAIPGAKYNGEYVAVIEPPQRNGTVTVTPLPVTGTPISADRAFTEAAKFVSTLGNNPRFRELTGLQPQKPLLVNPERRGYYLIPYARAGGAPTAAVVINAYNGAFMKAGRFPSQPMQTETQAVSGALRYLGRERAASIKTSLIALAGDGFTYFPTWRVVADGQEVLIEQNGRVRNVLPPPCGNLQKSIVTGQAGWTLVGSPGVTTPMQPVTVPTIPGWATLPGASWISVDAQGGGRSGDYVYEAEFCLCSEAINPRMVLTFFADNGATVFLNGKQLYATTGDRNFQIPVKSLTYGGSRADWIIPGTNKVRVVVNNVSGPTGLAATLTIEADGGACPNR